MILFFLTSGLFWDGHSGQWCIQCIWICRGIKDGHIQESCYNCICFCHTGAVIQELERPTHLANWALSMQLADHSPRSGCSHFSLCNDQVFTSGLDHSAIVGAIIGWNIFTGNPTDGKILSKIVMTWITGQSWSTVRYSTFILVNRFKRAAGIHLIRFESYVRTGLIIVELRFIQSGANNIANVMGVFALHSDSTTLTLDYLQLTQPAAFSSWRTGNCCRHINIFEKSYGYYRREYCRTHLEAAMVVVLAQSLVLFIFSSSALSDFLSACLPPIPMVPVSSSQVVVGVLSV